MRLAPTLFAAVGAVAATPQAALAHAHLLQAQPAADATLHSSPKMVRLTFSEPLILSFSGLQVRDAAGHALHTGKAALDPNRRVLTLPLRDRLPAGLYTVHWRAVSADTHRVEGRYQIRLAP